MGYVYILATVSLTVYGQLVLKQQVSQVSFPPDGLNTIPFLVKFCFRPLVFSSLLAAVFASFAWMAALSKFELSYAYPFMSLNFVLVVFVSIVLFGEILDIYKILGLAMIVGGVLVLSMSGRA